jgi:3-isopropylmalate/(R)-2-methylmalate dehydratase small subunit
MEPFVRHRGKAAPLRLANVDTDQIIPARFMKKPRAAGYGRYLFHDLRFDADGRERGEFVLNQEPWRDASVLVTGDNFGCGSSREAAVYALVDFGVRCVVAPSFGDIFRQNAQKNGLLPIVLEPAAVARLDARLAATPGFDVSVDLEACTLATEGLGCWSFTIDPFARSCLLEGLDDIDLTRGHEDAIADFERRRAETAPWSLPARRVSSR